jgi:CcmD family protein
MNRTDRILMVTVLAVVVTGLLGAAPAPVAAGQGGQPAAQARPADPQNEFVPVKNLPQQEKLPAAPLLIAAYAFVWAVLLVYVWSVWRRLMKVEGEVHALSGRLESKRGRG